MSAPDEPEEAAGAAARPDDETIVDRLLELEPRYQPGAYQFVREALDFRVSQLAERRHISGQELLDGVRQYAFDRFGPMARTVLNHWGIEAGEDVGRIVFLLIEVGVLSKTDEDTLDDFSGVVRFDDEFERTYRWL